MSGLADLIARLGQATGPDRELDGELQNVLDGELQSPTGFMTSEADHDYPLVPNYTESIDAALTLVPEGHTWSVDTHERVERNADGWAWENVLTPNPINYVAFRSTAPIPAIALCIAALKARAASPTGIAQEE